MTDRPRYTFEYEQLFNVFGAPGIPNTYRATLYRNGKVYEERDFHFRVRAESQCMKWVALYQAVPA